MKFCVTSINTQKHICLTIATLKSLGEKTASAAAENRWNHGSLTFLSELNLFPLKVHQMLHHCSHEVKLSPGKDFFLLCSIILSFTPQSSERTNDLI